MNSKKLLALFGGLVYLVAGHKFGMDKESLALGAGLVSAYILAQGVADHGKAAAEIAARPAQPDVTVRG